MEDLRYHAEILRTRRFREGCCDVGGVGGLYVLSLSAVSVIVSTASLLCLSMRHQCARYTTTTMHTTRTRSATSGHNHTRQGALGMEPNLTATGIYKCKSTDKTDVIRAESCGRTDGWKEGLVVPGSEV